MITTLENELWESCGMIPFTKKQRQRRALRKEFEKWDRMYNQAWDIMRMASRQKQRILAAIAELNECTARESS